MEQRYVRTCFKFEAPFTAEPPSLYSLPAQNRISQEEFDDFWRRLYSKSKFVKNITIIIISICLISSFASLAFASSEKYFGLFFAIQFICIGSSIGLLLFLLCAAKRILTKIIERENEQYWLQRGMKWEVNFYEQEGEKGSYYFQLFVVPNTVEFRPREEYSDERTALREALIS